MHIGLNAHLLSSAAGYRRAGIHSYIAQLLDQLPRAAPDWQFTIFAGAGHPPAHPQFKVRHAEWAAENPIRRILWEQLAQPWQLGGLDLVHEMAFVAPLVMPRPFVVTVYDLTFMRYPERLTRLRRIYLRLFTALSCRRARRVQAISQSTADDLTKLLHVSPEKIDLIIPGINSGFHPLPKAEVEAFRRARGLPNRFILCVSTIEPRKNLPLLLRAYAALPETERQTVQLMLAGGKGWLFDEVLRTIEQLDLADTVHLLGFVPDAELALWYNAAETFVYPSVFEGWGLPVTEAMACGKPVIVSNVSSLPEAVGEAGLQVPADQEEKWTEALAFFNNDPGARERYGQQAIQRAARFTWRKTAEATIESYQKALRT